MPRDRRRPGMGMQPKRGLTAGRIVPCAAGGPGQHQFLMLRQQERQHVEEEQCERRVSGPSHGALETVQHTGYRPQRQITRRCYPGRRVPVQLNPGTFPSAGLSAGALRGLTHCVRTYNFDAMGNDLQSEIRQSRPFSSRAQEAYLSVGRTWARLEHEMGEALKPYGVTPTQYNVLRILRGAGSKGLCRSEIMERMIARVPDATRLLDRMEAARLIDRTRDTQDRRFVTTRITEEGLQLLAETEEPVMALHRRQFDAVAERDLDRLVRVLEQVRNSSSGVDSG